MMIRPPAGFIDGGGSSGGTGGGDIFCGIVLTGVDWLAAFCASHLHPGDPCLPYAIKTLFPAFDEPALLGIMASRRVPVLSDWSRNSPPRSVTRSRIPPRPIPARPVS